MSLFKYVYYMHKHVQFVHLYSTATTLNLHVGL